MTCGSIYFGSIYKIKFPNGKHYIGLTTTSLEQRTKEHKKSAKNGDSQYIIYKAIRKYEMVDTLELIEIDTADTIEELYEKEIGYIREYNSYYMNENGYNMTYGGERTNGYVFTEEVKQKMSESRKKHFEKPDAREQHSKRIKKHFEDNPEAGKEHSERLKKYFENNPKAGKEHGERMKKYYENPEAIQKCSESQKKRFDNPEARRKSSRGENKPFDVFTLDGTFIKTFTYQFEAKEYLQTEYKITSTFTIGAVLAGKRKSSAGFVFKYK
jgi:group I intron endonuclease